MASVTVRGLTSLLNQNGSPLDYRYVLKMFYEDDYIDHTGIPTKKSLSDGLFEINQADMVMVTQKGQEHFLNKFAGKS
jgi:hypothetical protein